MKKLITTAIPALVVITLSACHSGSNADTTLSESGSINAHGRSQQARFDYLHYRGESLEQVSVSEDEYRNPLCPVIT